MSTRYENPGALYNQLLAQNPQPLIATTAVQASKPPRASLWPSMSPAFGNGSTTYGLESEIPDLCGHIATIFNPINKDLCAPRGWGA